jgi:Bacterial transcriptional activator domain.
MSTSKDRQTEVVEAAEASLQDVTAQFLEGPLLDTALQVWHDFTDETDVSRTKKPETWAAALLYTIDRLQMGSNVSQNEAADLFDVSAQSVGKKYRQIADTLALTVADPDYLPEGLRRQLQRELGALPDETPLLDETSGSYWHVPYGYREDDPFQSAQDLVYDGWDALWDDEVERAAECFEEALELDDMLADAYNGLAGVALRWDDLETAENHYQRAYELARESLGTEAPDAFHWWGQLETRPYMRSREGRAWVYWTTGRYDEAIDEYEALLQRNPKDNQGVRYVIGPLYQLAGDLEEALEAYDRYAEKYSEGQGDPHHTFCWGLALFQDGQRKAALRRWRKALFQNVYVAPLLLDEPLPDPDVWFGTNLATPDYAATYVNLFLELWEDAPAARRALDHLWSHDEVQAALEEWVGLSRELDSLAASEQNSEESDRRRQRLVTRRRSIADTFVSDAALRRILNRLS